MQNAALAELGLNWRFLAHEVRPEQLPQAIQGAKAMHYIGVNLTVPHKLLAPALMDVLDASARTWGAVNTVRFEGQAGDGTWKPLGEFPELPKQVRSQGFNTDADAISRSLTEDLGLPPVEKTVLLLGAGGAGRTAALKLASEGVRSLFLVNRTESKAVAVAVEIRQRFPAVRVVVGYPSEPVDLLLNATSAGLNESDPLPLDERAFPLDRTGAVYDMIYSPVQTRLLQKAAAAGRRTANGVGMLVYQGARALELWTGRAAPVKVMRQALEQHLDRT
jgi:shikimate dehydrogenase